MEESEKLNYHWYILVVQGGKEKKVVSNIELELEEKNSPWANYIQDLKIAKKILKGYIFCYCHLTPALVNFFYKIEGVISFLNHKKSDLRLPSFVSEETTLNFFQQLEKEENIPLATHDSNLNTGDLVRITEGSFVNYEGRIVNLDKKTSQVKIEIEFLGRKTFFCLPANNCKKF